MKLFAISDLHLGFAQNRRALESLAADGSHREDWLILAGDVGETLHHMAFAAERLAGRFAKLLWVPGNHELWTVGKESHRGVGKYDSLVRFCRDRGILTPDDPFVQWQGEGAPCIIAPLFLLYDYTFRPDEISSDEAVAWARESGVLCADERRLHPDPFPSRQAWCHARCDAAELALADAGRELPLVLINHFPLRQELVRIPRIPRFSIWCGTRRTHDWHRRFNARVVVSGHLHVRATDWIDGVRFEEVSLGYPRHWNSSRPIDSYLREILPGPERAPR